MIHDLQPALKDYGRLSLLKKVDEQTVDYYSPPCPRICAIPTPNWAGRMRLLSLAQILETLGNNKGAASNYQPR